MTTLQPFTNYTCCISASNQVGEGERACITIATIPGEHGLCKYTLQNIIITCFNHIIAPPTKPVAVSTLFTGIHSTTLVWKEPANSYGQDILSYTISCTSLDHTVNVDAVHNMSIEITSLYSDTNYTCCVVALNSVGQGNSACLLVSTSTPCKHHVPFALPAKVQSFVFITQIALCITFFF